MHMWESNRTKVIIGNILLFLAIVAIVAGLVYAMFRIREINRVQDEELTELYNQQKQVQNEQRQEPTVSIQAEYEKDLATIEEYMPGIVCWGDGTTAAASVSLNYPYVLQTYIDTYICDIYDFSSTIENAAELPRFNWDDYKVSIPVVNMGAGKESTYTILGRAGVIPYVVGAELVIPADTESVPITLWSAVRDYTYVTPLTGGDFGVNPVVIDGIEGRLSINSEDYNYNGTLNYFFTRSTPGEEKTIPAGTVITTAGTNMYKDYIHVILMGVYGEYQGADDLVQQIGRGELRNPVVEKILNQMVNVVNAIAETYGKPDEIHIELARELKQNAKERERASSDILTNNKRNQEITQILQKDFMMIYQVPISYS